jgi:hypothetical protein
MTLTDEDRDNIERAKDYWSRDTNDGDGVRVGYLAGLRAGLELAAKVADKEVKYWRTEGYPLYMHAVEACAAAIRALAK